MGFDLSTIQQASIDAINERTIQIMFGKVTSVQPLKIKISDAWELTEEFIVLDSPVEQGEEVIILQYATGNKYLVLSTVEKVYQSSAILGGVVAQGSSVSDKVWNYLTSSGFSDEVAAGILGNMMTECGGNTLNLQWNVRGHYYGYTFYGLCQWCSAYFPSVQGRDVQGQLDFLMSNIASQINAYGFNYSSGFNFSKFKQLGVEQAAVAFAVCYERPGYEANNYGQRRQNALTAYRTYHKSKN